jgi:hypothetical protein
MCRTRNLCNEKSRLYEEILILKLIIKKQGFGPGWVHMVDDRVQWPALVHTAINLPGIS